MPQPQSQLLPDSVYFLCLGGALDKYAPIPEPVLGRMAVNIIQGLCYMWSLKILHRGKRLPAETKTAQSVQHNYSMFITVCNTVMYSTNKQKLQQNHNIYSKIKTFSTEATCIA